MVFIYKVTRLNYFYTQYVFQIHTYLVIQIVTDLTSFFPLVNSCCFSVTGITFSPEWPVFYHFYCVREAKKSASLATNLSASFFFCVVPKTCCSCWFYARDKKKDRQGFWNWLRCTYAVKVHEDLQFKSIIIRCDLLQVNIYEIDVNFFSCKP